MHRLSVPCQGSVKAPEEVSAAQPKDTKGRTALHMVALHQPGKAAVLQLLEKEANIAARDKGGWTPLHLAASNWHGEVVQALLEKGADEFMKDKEGRRRL
jgi:ankyrin repeat protein